MPETAKVTSNGKTKHAFPFTSIKRLEGCQASPLLNIVLEILVNATHAEKGKKGIKVGKKEMKNHHL